MSGGVDSSTAACLLKEQGFDCHGAIMQLFDSPASCAESEKNCGSPTDAEDAKKVAQRLEIPFHVLDFSGDFEKQVITRFVEAYQSGLTPNPCVICNRFLKFESFLRCGQELGLDRMATGHYVRVEYDSVSKRYLLYKSVDPEKDQSYVLYALTQQQLAKTIFPLGQYRKQEIREIAQENGLLNASKKESQDICFVPDGDYAAFIERQTGEIPPPGDFVDCDGRVLGRHRGLIRYTVGQRKGLGIARATPYYVCSLEPASNTVVLGDEDDLYSQSLEAVHVNLIAMERIDKPIRIAAKVRYRQKEEPATLEQTGDDRVRVTFDKPQKAVTPGQAVVFYSGDIVLGGAVIVKN